MKHSGILSKNELIGIFLLINKLINLVLRATSFNFSLFIDDNFFVFSRFIIFLTDGFIFGVHGVPILTEKVIK
jgi:hypothetical protein